MSITGIALTLAAPLPIGIAGLAMMSTGVFVTQAASQGYLGVGGRPDRGAAAALYLTIYYSGCGLGAVLPAGIWQHGGWPATVALILVVQIAAAVLARYGWQGAASRPVENALA
ncbi:MAG: hypothetical protein GIW95_06715 [Candidatus Eremiobacteraeota bacterium]|nr:hypothetical protein [Candidatus Eremiobacteraeota bacterium]